MNTCKNCGGTLINDGFTGVIHCEFADYDDCIGIECDAEPVYCDFDNIDDNILKVGDLFTLQDSVYKLSIHDKLSCEICDLCHVCCNSTDLLPNCGSGYFIKVNNET